MLPPGVIPGMDPEDEDELPRRIIIRDPENILHRAMAIGCFGIMLVCTLELVTMLLLPGDLPLDELMAYIAGGLISLVMWTIIGERAPGVIIDFEGDRFVYTSGLWARHAFPLSVIYAVHLYDAQHPRARGHTMEIQTALGRRRLRFADRRTRFTVYVVLRRMLAREAEIKRQIRLQRPPH